jgi:carboxyl-terminal processing protease
MTRETGVQKITMVLCALALFGAGYYVGHATVASNAGVLDLASTTPPQGIQVNFGTFWDVWTLINDRFIDASSTDAQTKVYGAISGLVNSLDDPYSVFLPPQDASSFNDMIAGSFGGVGMEVGKRDGALTVISPLKGSPAELAGVRAGDIIVEINGTSTAEMSIDDAVELIRGPIGTAVHLTLSREGASEFLEKKIVRQSIDIPALDTTARPDGIFVLSLYNFDATATRKVRDALSQFVASGDRKLILDLHKNPNGFLDTTVDITEYFLPESTIVIKEKTDQEHSNKHTNTKT